VPRRQIRQSHRRGDEVLPRCTKWCDLPALEMLAACALIVAKRRRFVGHALTPIDRGVWQAGAERL